MRTRTTLAALCCATLGTGLAACGDDDDKGDGARATTVTITERDTDDFGFVDTPPKTVVNENGPQRVSAGDTLSFRSDLLRAGKDVGDLLAVCTVVSGADFRTAGVTCHATYELPEGKLAVQVGGAGIFAAKSVDGVITGGTKRYAHATGTFSSPSGDGDTVTTMKLRMPAED
jgi:hypothetical protein